MVEPTLQTTRDPDIYAIGTARHARVRKGALFRRVLRLQPDGDLRNEQHSGADEW